MVNSPCKTYIIIVAAGSGNRFGSPLPKQYAMLCGKPVLVHTINSFRKALPQARICTVLHPDYKNLWLDLWSQYGDSKEAPEIVFGGASRAESVFNAMRHFRPEEGSAVLIHDGARPFVPENVIRRLLDKLATDRSAVPVLPMTDSIRQLREGGSGAVDRSRYVRVQTPQAFRGGNLMEAYLAAEKAGFGLFTDDASVVEAVWPGCVATVEGDENIIKITHPLDLKIAELILRGDQHDA